MIVDNQKPLKTTAKYIVTSFVYLELPSGLSQSLNDS